jgi:hypothetical protein
MCDTFTNTTSSDSTKIDLDNLVDVYNVLQADFAKSFVGIPIKVDDTLEGNHYYIAVSRELLNEIEFESQKSSFLSK